MALDIDLTDPAALDAHPALGPVAELCSVAYSRGYDDALCRSQEGCLYNNRLLRRAYNDGWLAGDSAPDRDNDDHYEYEEA